MAWPNFSLSDLYTAVITNLNSRLQDTGKLFNGVTTTGAEFTDQVKYNSSTKRLERWNGSAWVALDLSATTVDNATKAGGLSVSQSGVASSVVATDASGNLGIGATASSSIGFTPRVHIKATNPSYNIENLSKKYAIGITDSNNSLIFIDETLATTRMQIDAFGNLLVNQSSSTGSYKVEVGGAVKATSFVGPVTDSAGTGTAPKTVESGVRIIRGRIDSAGNILSGTGFTCSRPTTGNYLISFTNAFSTVPACVGSSEGNFCNITISPLAGSCYFSTTVSNTTTSINNPFTFIVIGS